MLTSKRDSSGWLEGVNFVNLEFFAEMCEKPQKNTKTITPIFHTKTTHSSCPTPRKRKTGQLTTPPLRGGSSSKHSESPSHPFLKRDSSGQLGQLDRKIRQDFDIEYGLVDKGCSNQKALKELGARQ